MQITLITPAPPGSKAGNRATAERWERLLTREGHQVKVVSDYEGEPCDLFIALHAWRSREAVRRFRDAFPDKPLIVVLTGTDIYDHQHRFPDDTRYAMAQADCLIGLHRRVALDIPARFAKKLVTVLQSADSVPDRHSGTGQAGQFQVCVIGHLRAEKDSLRAAKAARLLPEASEITVVNAGKAHNDEWQAAAQEEQAANRRFQWLGELDRGASQQLMLNSRLMVISSVMEGGANVVSEACRMGLPILASDISGNIGLLGHLVEMTRPSGVDAELNLGALPILPGAEETAAAGILSSLQPANIRLRRGIRDQERWVKHPRYPLIFDPQTAGGLLASVPADQADACVAELRRLGYPHTAIIGRVLPQDETGPIEPITLTD